MASQVDLYTCRELIAELGEALAHRKFDLRLRNHGLQPLEINAGYAALTKLIVNLPTIPPTCRDPDDDIVLACALAAQVTGARP